AARVVRPPGGASATVAGSTAGARAENDEDENEAPTPPTTPPALGAGRNGHRRDGGIHRPVGDVDPDRLKPRGRGNDRDPASHRSASRRRAADAGNRGR